MLQPIIHYGIHFILPIILALAFFRSQWKKATVIMLLCILIDLDHLIASPIFNSNRCSIGYHPLHSYYAILVYFFFLFKKKTRILGVGLLNHIVADSADCLMM